MNIFDMLRPRGRATTSLASQVAHEITAEVWMRALARMGSMRLAEARGYLRATATEAASARVDAALLRSRGIDVSARANIVTLAAEGVVERLEADLVRVPRSSGLRRAA
jgi:hypothetical protein